MSAQSKSSQQLLTNYTPTNIDLLSSRLGLESVLRPSEISAASRAILRRQAYRDGSHFAVKQEHGLHPEFIGVHGLGTPTIDERVGIVTLLDASKKDVFDAVSSSSR
jgi:hypothetical protein